MADQEEPEEVQEGQSQPAEQGFAVQLVDLMEWRKVAQEGRVLSQLVQVKRKWGNRRGQW